MSLKVAVLAAVLFLTGVTVSLLLHAAERGSIGDFYVVDYWHDRVIQFDGSTGERVRVFAEFNYPFKALPYGITFGGPNNNMFVAPSGFRFISEFDGETGDLVRNIPLREGACAPTELKIGPNGNLFVAHHSCMEFAVEEYDSATGAFIGSFLTLTKDISKVAFSPAGDLYVLRSNSQHQNFIEVLEVDWVTRRQRRVVELRSDGGRGALTFGAGGELWVSTKFDVYGFDTKSWSLRFIAHNDEPIWDIEAGLKDSPYAYVVTEGDKVFEIDTIGGRVTRRVVADVEGDGLDDRTDGPLDLGIKPPWIPRNEPPLARAGPDQTVRPGDHVVLTGGASSDPDIDYMLTYRWEILQRPAGSIAELMTTDTVVVELVPDSVGEYVINLRVTDSKGLYSEDQVVISTGNATPVADAGLDIPVVEIGSVVTLNGSGSIDPDGDPLAYVWEWVSRPIGSTAVLLDAVSATPQFVTDVHGEYLVSLVVEDNYGARSDRDTVAVSFVNVAPVVVANGPQEIVEQDTATVTALATDANLDPVVFCWRLVSRPAPSVATLQYSCYELSELAQFPADVPGYFVLEAVANDGFADSAPESVTIKVLSVEEAALDVLAELRRVLLRLPEREFEPGNKRKGLVHKVDLAVKAVKVGDRVDAIDQVQFIGNKSDGCNAASRPDNNDWLRSCAAEDAVYQLTVKATALLRRR